jgi:hypothetical protein
VALVKPKPNAIEQVLASTKVATRKATTKPSTIRKELQMELNFDSLENLELGEDDTRFHTTSNKEDGCGESKNNEGGGEARLDSRPAKNRNTKIIWRWMMTMVMILMIHHPRERIMVPLLKCLQSKVVHLQKKPRTRNCKYL